MSTRNLGGSICFVDVVHFYRDPPSRTKKLDPGLNPICLSDIYFSKKKTRCVSKAIVPFGFSIDDDTLVQRWKFEGSPLSRYWNFNLPSFINSHLTDLEEHFIFSLTLSNVYFSTQSMNCLSNWLCKDNHLKTLILSECNGVGFYDIPSIGRALQWNGTLKVLKILRCYRIRESDFELMLRYLGSKKAQRFSALEELEVKGLGPFPNNNHISDSIMQLLMNSKRLRIVDLDPLITHDVSAIALGNAVYYSTTLEWINCIHLNSNVLASFYPGNDRYGNGICQSYDFATGLCLLDDRDRFYHVYAISLSNEEFQRKLSLGKTFTVSDHVLLESVDLGESGIPNKVITVFRNTKRLEIIDCNLFF